MTVSTEQYEKASVPDSGLQRWWPTLLGLADERRRQSSSASHRQQQLAGVPLSVTPYVSLLTADGPWTVAHLGQSIDGCIATASGHSIYVTGRENLTHLHRLRALADAVIVGGGTALADDPQLTVRRVEGVSPVRVVIDSRGQLPASLGLFTDRGPDTLHVVPTGGARDQDPARRVEIEPVQGRLPPAAIRAALAERGLQVLFVEGGGLTVTQWLQAGALDRLHIAIAPVLIGDGRRALSLPSAKDMPAAMRPPATLHRMGDDVLWDLDLSGQ